jgi:4-amino-4-deoxy-L-arabinose transferase-like glycosyltransferase
VVLSLGERFGLREWVNPLLAGLSVWLTYRLGKKLLGELAGLLAAGLTLTSSFFLINTGSLLSHPWGLVLSAALALSWLDVVSERDSPAGWLPTLSAGLSLGVLALSRPLTALAVALPFGMHGLILLWRGSSVIRKRVLIVGVITLLVISLHFLWQYALTGDALLNPYTLWWDYDKFGFGPGHGVTDTGHNLTLARYNTKHSLRAGLRDLFGWGIFSWIFLPFGVWAVRRERHIWPLVGVFPALVLVYAAYWVGAWVFGPRYYFEGLYSLTLLTAAGIAWLAGWPLRPGQAYQPLDGWRKARPLAITALLLFLLAGNLLFYTPMRVGGMQGLFGIQSAQLAPFDTPKARALDPALVIVHPSNWRQYCGLLQLSNPYLDTPFVFVYHRGPDSTAEIIDQFPNRTVVHYYPNKPYQFYFAENP